MATINNKGAGGARTSKPARTMKPAKPAPSAKPMKPRGSSQVKPTARRGGTETHPRARRDLRAEAIRRMRPGVTLTDEQREGAQELFLLAFSRCANVSLSCRAAGVSRASLYRWQEHDDRFSIRYQHCKADAIDLLEQEAWRRAVSGVEKTVVSMGKVVMVDGKPLTEKTYSDSLLVQLLRAHNPAFRERSHLDVTSDGQRMVEKFELAEKFWQEVRSTTCSEEQATDVLERVSKARESKKAEQAALEAIAQFTQERNRNMKRDEWVEHDGQYDEDGYSEN